MKYHQYPQERGVNYLHKFKTSKGIPACQTSGVGEFSLDDSKNGDELEIYKGVILIAMLLLRILSVDAKN